jgi:hypothetical protein
MLKEFLEVASAMDFSPMQEAFGTMSGGAGVRVLYTTWSGNGCELGLHLWRGGEANNGRYMAAEASVSSVSIERSETPPERWTVRCAAVDDYRFLAAPCSELRLADDHVLLERYTAPIARLYFRGRPSNVPDAVGALAAAHWRHTGDWVSLATYLNPHSEPAALLTAGSGCLAQGPRLLLEAYAVALRRHGVDPSLFLSAFTSQRSSSPPGRQVLLLTPSYVVGSGFEADRH